MMKSRSLVSFFPSKGFFLSVPQPLKVSASRVHFSGLPVLAWYRGGFLLLAHPPTPIGPIFLLGG